MTERLTTKTLFICLCVLLLVLALNDRVSRAAQDRGHVSFTAQVVPLVDSAYYGAVGAELRGATKSIHCAMYLAKYNPGFPDGLEASLLKDIASARKRGVNVCVILDGNERAWEDQDKVQRRRANQEAFDLLAKAGVDVRYDSDDVLLHSKLIVIDESVTILGSTNWTYSALRKNHEASVIIRSTGVARRFLEGFERIETQHE